MFWNFIHYIHEDDCNLTSFFYWDLPHLAKFINSKNVVNIQYHSYESHGDFHYQISNGKIELQPTKSVKTNSELLLDLIDFTKKHYKPDHKNAIFFSTHCYKQFLRTFSTDISLQSWVDECVKDDMSFEFILFDGCYTATVDTLVQLKPVTRYIVGCQSASPYLGYNTEEMADIFSECLPTLELLRKLCESYIKRNDTAKYPSLKFYTDSVILDVKHLDDLLNIVNNTTIVKKASARVEPSIGCEDLYDLTLLLKNKEILSLIIVYYKKTKELEKRYWGRRLHGLSLVVN